MGGFDREDMVKGKCEPDCNREEKPVCALDNKTYLNLCFAHYNGLGIRHFGRCDYNFDLDGEYN
ncbi:MAG: hypothetical protein GY772_25720 [bacterium]|nr:hypothetical protein [bacterium]